MIVEIVLDQTTTECGIAILRVFFHNLYKSGERHTCEELRDISIVITHIVYWEFFAVENVAIFGYTQEIWHSIHEIFSQNTAKS